MIDALESWLTPLLSISATASLLGAVVSVWWDHALVW